MDQRGLIERARRGEHDAFTALLDVHLARLDAAARLILRDPELARDAVQEALIRAWRDLPGLRDPDRFDAWLHRLTVNACLDLDPAPQAPGHRGRAQADRLRRRRHDAAGALADRELLDQALDAPGPGHRAVVALHYLLGMPLPEVAHDPGHPRRERPSPGCTTHSRRCGPPSPPSTNPSRPSSREGSSHDLDRDASNRTCRHCSPTCTRAGPPTTEMTSSSRSPACGSGPPGRSPKGGFPWISSTPSVFRRGASRGASLASSALIGAAHRCGPGSIRRLATDRFPPRSVSQPMVSSRYVDDTGAIQRVDPVSGEAVVIVPGPGNSRPTYSPDGSKLAYLRARRRYRIRHRCGALGRSRAGRASRRSHSRKPGYLGWSPDNASIVISVPAGRHRYLRCVHGGAGAHHLRRWPATRCQGLRRLQRQYPGHLPATDRGGDPIPRLDGLGPGALRGRCRWVEQPRDHRP